ncbi:hypothetical protein [Chitinophaga sp. YIM B06452]|uniref:hypothetical protein n=1 Tax=Chitinophaga sp. YIM B06452 TaxID=3082158 RepID=UPI0031FEA4BC
MTITIIPFNMKMGVINIRYIAAAIALTGSISTTIGNGRERLISGCWVADSITLQVRDLADPGSPTPKEIFSPIQHITKCSDLENQIFSNEKFYVRKLRGDLEKITPGDLLNGVFCCLIIQEIDSSSSHAYKDLPAINIGEGNKKYRVMEVRCH